MRRIWFDRHEPPVLDHRLTAAAGNTERTKGGDAAAFFEHIGYLSSRQCSSADSSLPEISAWVTTERYWLDSWEPFRKQFDPRCTVPRCGNLVLRPPPARSAHPSARRRIMVTGLVAFHRTSAQYR